MICEFKIDWPSTNGCPSMFSRLSNYLRKFSGSKKRKISKQRNARRTNNVTLFFLLPECGSVPIKRLKNERFDLKVNSTYYEQVMYYVASSIIDHHFSRFYIDLTSKDIELIARHVRWDDDEEEMIQLFSYA